MSSEGYSDREYSEAKGTSELKTRNRITNFVRGNHGYDSRRGPRQLLIIDTHVPPNEIESLLTIEIMDQWRNPPGRPLVFHLAEGKIAKLVVAIQTSKQIPDVLTVGVWSEIPYLLDGKHRREAMRICGIQQVMARVRWVTLIG